MYDKKFIEQVFMVSFFCGRLAWFGGSSFSQAFGRFRGARDGAQLSLESVNHNETTNDDDEVSSEATAAERMVSVRPAAAKKSH